MPSLARLRCLAASALAAAAVLASSEDAVACSGEGCDAALGSAGEEEAALLQVHRANESGPWKNPCTGNYMTNILPKQSEERACKKAGFSYIGDKQCCVPAAYVCNLGTEKDCKGKFGSSAAPKWLGVITDQRGKLEGNCCLAPIPKTSGSATWAWGVDSANEKTCTTKKVSKSCTVEAFYTGSMCMTSAKQNGKYSPAKCKKTAGKCSGVDIGEGKCCTCR